MCYDTNAAMDGLRFATVLFWGFKEVESRMGFPDSYEDHMEEDSCSLLTKRLRLCWLIFSAVARALAQLIFQCARRTAFIHNHQNVVFVALKEGKSCRAKKKEGKSSIDLYQVAQVFTIGISLVKRRIGYCRPVWPWY